MKTNNLFKNLVFIGLALGLFLGNSVFADNEAIRNKIISIAEAQIGNYYERNQYGGWPPGFDCSGLVGYSHLKAGFFGFGGVSPFSHGPTTTTLVAMSNPINIKDLLPGDIVFQHGTYDKNGDGRISLNDSYSHVGIYKGGNKVIQSGTGGVTIMSFYNWMSPSYGAFAGARRIKAEYWPAGYSLEEYSEEEFEELAEDEDFSLLWGQLLNALAEGNETLFWTIFEKVLSF